jgi:hypothetical protein
VAALARRGIRLDSVVGYVKAGKESYQVVAVFDQFEYRHAAQLFRRLSALRLRPQPAQKQAGRDAWSSISIVAAAS